MKYNQNKGGNIIVSLLVIGVIIWGIVSLFSNSNSPSDSSDYYQNETYDYENYEYDGYAWAEYYDISSFEECQDQFGTSYEEDECNRYVKENYSGYDTFYGYNCTEDCSGHEAGYVWAEENNIYDKYDCDGYSDSFIEGCISFVEENY